MKKILKRFVGLFSDVHQAERRSLSSWAIEKGMWVIGLRTEKGEVTPEQYLADAQKASENYKIPKVASDQKTTTLSRMQVVTWNDKSDKNQKVLFYLHGGAYMFEANKIQMAAIKNIAEKLDAKVVMPVYPLAPKYTFKTAYEDLDVLYKQILASTSSNQNVTIIGDSAGGGLSLGFAMYARDHKLAQPKDIILISPWIDLTLSNPQIAQYEKLDPMLTAWAGNISAKSWAGSASELKNPYVSPIYGDFNDLGRISIFVGTHELVLPDIQKFDQLLTQQNIEHTYVQKDKMNHAYVMYPIPEARDAQNQIVNIIKNK